MRFVFTDNSGAELALPVTPPGFEVSHGVKVETINIHTVGDVIIGGHGALCSLKVECMLPKQRYAFAHGWGDPYGLVGKFKAWCSERAVLRFAVTGTPVSMPVLIEEIKYGERDGTGDVYATLSLREHRELTAVRTQKNEQTGNESRPEPEPPPTAQEHTVVSGDTMWAISRRYYGEPTLCYALATYNGIRNANLIYPGQVVRLPDKSLLR